MNDPDGVPHNLEALRPHRAGERPGRCRHQRMSHLVGGLGVRSPGEAPALRRDPEDLPASDLSLANLPERLVRLFQAELLDRGLDGD